MTSNAIPARKVVRVGKKKSTSAGTRRVARLVGETDQPRPPAAGPELLRDDFRPPAPAEVWPTPGLRLEQTQTCALSNTPPS